MTDLDTLQELAAGDNYLTTYYRYQFVQNENLRLERTGIIGGMGGTYSIWTYRFQEQFILPDSVSIVFEVDGETITQGYTAGRQLALEENPDLIAFTDFNAFEGTLEIWWHNEPTNITLVASYEFDYYAGEPIRLRESYIPDTVKVNWKRAILPL